MSDSRAFCPRCGDPLSTAPPSAPRESDGNGPDSADTVIDEGEGVSTPTTGERTTATVDTDTPAETAAETVPAGEADTPAETAAETTAETAAETAPAGEANETDESTTVGAERGDDSATATDHPSRTDPAVVGLDANHGGELCDACYFERFEFVDAPDRIDVRVCSTCGAVYRGNRWVDVGADDYTDIAIEEVSEAVAVHVDVTDLAWQVDPEQIDPNTIRMHASFTGVVRERLVDERVTIPVKIARQTCTRCGRIAGDYYASIVQIRAADREPTTEEVERAKTIANTVVAEMEATGDRNAFITETTETADGLDIKVSTNKIGKKIANKMVEEFGGTVTDAETLVTEDSDGNEVYRVTFAVRLPPYRPGDVIDLAADEDGPVLVRSAHGNLKGVRVTTGERYEASYEEGDSPEARRLGRLEEATDTPVVTVEDDHAVQVLDPETYEAKTVARPNYFDPDAESVPVLKSRAGLHVLPDEADE